MYNNILLLNGSTRVKGNSLNICKSLKKCILDKGLEVDIENIQDYFNQKSIESLKEKFIKADVIGIVAPVYVDTLPYPVIDFLEEIESSFSNILKGKSLFIIGQCNFPESRRVTPMILNCKCFAKEINMKWLGAMAYGGSVVRIEGRSLEEAGKEGQRMIKSLEMATEDIINEEEIRKEAIDLFKNDISPYMIKPFTIVANFMFRRAEKKLMKNEKDNVV